MTQPVDNSVDNWAQIAERHASALRSASGALQDAFEYGLGLGADRVKSHAGHILITFDEHKRLTDALDAAREWVEYWRSMLPTAMQGRRTVVLIAAVDALDAREATDAG